MKFTSGTEVINAMASGSIAFSLNGSSPTAAGYSRGVDLQVIYGYDNINDADCRYLLGPEKFRNARPGSDFSPFDRLCRSSTGIFTILAL